MQEANGSASVGASEAALEVLLLPDGVSTAEIPKPSWNGRYTQSLFAAVSSYRFVTSARKNGPQTWPAKVNSVCSLEHEEPDVLADMALPPDPPRKISWASRSDAGEKADREPSRPGSSSPPFREMDSELPSMKK